MAEHSEPDRNISGGAAGGGEATPFDTGEPTTRAEAVVDRLGERYWQKTYGGQSAFECLVRTILSQNTSDAASQPAHDALLDRYGGEDRDLVTALARADRETLAETISGAGLYNRKSKTIIRVAEGVLAEFGSAAAFDAFVSQEPAQEVRSYLLGQNGVGPKTADCVLLFAGGRDGVFPVDTHVHRIYRRVGIAASDADHEDVRETLEEAVPPEKCGFGHTASIQFGREVCTTGSPACLDGLEGCPLADLCERVGVDPDTGDVIDPSAASTTDR